MKIDPFLQCLKATGIDTGVSILGVYDFVSGGLLSGTSFVYNQLYSTGYHDYSGVLRKDALAFVYLGSESVQPSGNFWRTQPYQISNSFTGSFSLLLALNYSGCTQASSTSNSLIAATVDTNSNSGVYLCISPSSRLFAKIGGNYSTISKEIGPGDFAFLSVSDNRFVNFGLFSQEDCKFYSKQFDFGTTGSLEVKTVKLGRITSYPTSTVGYSGRIREAYLFSGAILESNVGKCVDCSYATGYSNSVTSGIFNQSTVVNSVWSGVSGTGITGYSYATLAFSKTAGTAYVAYDSGKSGVIELYQKIVPITQQTTGVEYYSGLSFSFDSLGRASGVFRDVYFDGGLSSGDIVEIYSYLTPSTNNGNTIPDFIFPPAPSGKEIQIFGNGLAETSGVDFSVAFNSQISGFDSWDYLQYDIVSGSRTMPYNTTYIKTGTSVSNSVIRITGASGVDFSTPFKWDIYFDGQKMMSGIDYQVSGSGSNSVIISDTGAAIWNDAFFDINLANYQEIKFLPLPTGLMKTSGIITSSVNFVSGVSGFDEQVWLNGVRQREGIDYLMVQRCRFCNGNFVEQSHSFSLYNPDNAALSPSGFVEDYVPTPDVPYFDWIWDGTVVGYADFWFDATMYDPPVVPGTLDFHIMVNSISYMDDSIYEDYALDIYRDGVSSLAQYRLDGMIDINGGEVSARARFKRSSDGKYSAWSAWNSQSIPSALP